jgi:hypothetical protein
MPETSRYEKSEQSDQEITLPGLFKRIQLNHTARIAEKLTPGPLTGEGDSKANVVYSRDGQSVEIWDDSDPTAHLHTVVEIAYDELGMMTPFITAKRETTYRGRGQEWTVPSRFSSDRNSDNSLSLHNVAAALRFAHGLQPAKVAEPGLSPQLEQ